MPKTHSTTKQGEGKSSERAPRTSGWADMAALGKFVKPYWYWALLAPLFMVVEVWMDLLQPRLIVDIVDVGIANGQLDVVVNTGLKIVGLALIGAVGGAGCTVFAVLAGFGFGTDLRDALYRKVQSLSFANLDQLETGKLVTRLTNDVTQVQNALMMLLRIMVRVPLLLVGSLAMAISTSLQLSPLFIVLIPLVLAITTFIIGRAFPLFRQVQDRLDGLNTVTQENLMGVRVVKAFVRGDHEITRFKKTNMDLMTLAVKAGRTVTLGMPLMMLAMNMGLVGVLWFGARYVAAGTLQVGQILAFVNYLMRTLFSLMMLSWLVLAFSRAGASATRIREVMDAEPTVQNRPGAMMAWGKAPGDGVALVADGGNGAGGNGAGTAVWSGAQGAVAFEHVTFAYDGEEHEPVLTDVNLTAKPGEMVAIMGATGSGKSTLVHLIPRFYDVLEGRVTLDGTDVRDLDMGTLRRQIGMAFQEPILFSGTIRDNIRYGRPEATDEEVEAAARMAQAHDFIVGFEDGYDTVLGQRGVNLSGGQKQRLAIARALAMDPAVLILDDSTSSVDVETEAAIQAALAGFARQRTTFVIAQRVSSVLTADKIVVLDRGQVAAEGTHTELLASSPIYREIYTSQLGNGGANG